LLAEVRRLAAIVENHPDFIGVGSLEGRALYVNPAGLKMMGLPPDHDVTSMETGDFYAADDAARLVDEGFSTALQEGFWSAEANLLTADGQTVPVEQTVSVNYDVNGEPSTLSITMHDITERRRTAAEQERLLADIQQLAAIVESHPDFISVGTLEGKALYVNPAGLKMMGLPPDHDVTSMSADDFFPAEDAERLLKEGLPTALETGAWVGEADLLKADGRTVPVEQSIGINPDIDGSPASFSMTMHDITNRKQAALEQQRLLAEVEASYRQFVRREWEKYLQEQHQGKWHIERAEAEMDREASEAWLNVLQTEVMREGKTKATGSREDNGDTQPAGNADGTAAIISPISLRGQVIGTLNLQDSSSDRRWTDEEIALVEAVSEQLALTVENLRLFDDTQRRATREQLTRQITDKMHAAPDVDTIIQTGLNELANVLGVSRSYVKLGSSQRSQNLENNVPVTDDELDRAFDDGVLRNSVPEDKE
jgi:PAS domain S-box-containing protein